MPSQKQIEANRLNSQKSTGPRSVTGRAAVRFNALKTGIHAQSQVIPGEDPAALAALAAEYHDRYQPATPEVRALVDTLITAEWMQRRFRTLEAQLFQVSLNCVFREQKGLTAAQAYNRDAVAFDRLQRRINAAERSFHHALAALQKIESLPTPPSPEPEPLSPDPEPPSNQSPDPEIGFVPPTPILMAPSGPEAHELPINTPVKNTSAPPNPTCNAAENVGVSI